MFPGGKLFWCCGWVNGVGVIQNYFRFLCSSTEWRLGYVFCLSCCWSLFRLIGIIFLFWYYLTLLFPFFQEGWIFLVSAVWIGRVDTFSCSRQDGVGVWSICDYGKRSCLSQFSSRFDWLVGCLGFMVYQPL